MVSQATLLILGGCLIGAIQLIAGIALGTWLRRSESSEANRHDMMQARLIAERLKGLAAEMTSSANEHRTQLEQASQMLTSDDGRSDDALAELVVDVIGDIVRANQNLQSKLETAEHKLEEQALEIEAHISRSLTDPLTGLPNRREFNARLEERMSAWKRRHEVFSLLLLDVDHFKKLNDVHGHLAGDQVLAAMGRVLRGAVRREDAVARYGGEEFAILLPNSTLDQAMCVAEKVRESVAAVCLEHNHQRISVTVSGGLAAIQVADTSDSLIQKADAALYAAKASGRNRTCVHDGRVTMPAGRSERLVELIHLADADSGPSGNDSADFGTYLQRDVISTELARTCDELRRFVEERRQRQDDAVSPSRT